MSPWEWHSLTVPKYTTNIASPGTPTSLKVQEFYCYGFLVKIYLNDRQAGNLANIPSTVRQRNTNVVD